MRFLNLGVWHQEEPPEPLTLKSLSTDAPQDSTLGGHTDFKCTASQGEVVTPQEPGPGLPKGLRASSGKVGLRLTAASRTPVAEILGNIH